MIVGFVVMQQSLLFRHPANEWIEDRSCDGLI